MEEESTFEKQSKVPLRESEDLGASYKFNRDTLATSTDLKEMRPYEPPLVLAGQSSKSGSMMSVPASNMYAKSSEESSTSVNIDGAQTPS